MSWSEVNSVILAKPEPLPRRFHLQLGDEAARVVEAVGYFGDQPWGGVDLGFEAGEGDAGFGDGVGAAQGEAHVEGGGGAFEAGVFGGGGAAGAGFVGVGLAQGFGAFGLAHGDSPVAGGLAVVPVGGDTGLPVARLALP